MKTKATPETKKPSKKPNEKGGEATAAFDDVLQKMLEMPYEPHEKKEKSKKPSPKR